MSTIERSEWNIEPCKVMLLGGGRGKPGNIQIRAFAVKLVKQCITEVVRSSSPRQIEYQGVVR